MRIYRVGGAVRDALLGEPSHDSDWVVVGATPEQMIEAGYQPVGRDFPVFLHPDTHEEYALARTERKTGAGYRGFAVHFAPDVTLEDDLLRRDLTINAMAMSAEGELIDPYGGRDDLRDGLFRHVSDAFAEDPVRILRVARFAARLTRFRVHPDTLALMRRMVAAGEADALVPERVWQEVSRGLMQAAPYRMIAVLADCGALARAMPGIEPGPVLEASLACAAAAGAPLSARYALLVAAGVRDGDAPRATSVSGPLVGDPLAERLRVPVDCRDIARLLLAEHDALDRVPHCDARALLALLERLDALRRPQRIEPLATAAACLAHARAEGGRLPDAAGAPCPPGVAQHAQAVAQRLHDARAVARAVDAGRIAQARLADGPEAVRAAIFEARAASIEAAGV